MKTKAIQDQQGFSAVGLSIIILLLTIAAAGWWLWHWHNLHKTPDKVSLNVRQAIKAADCFYDDRDLCKFFSGWKATTVYSLTATQQSKTSQTVATMKVDGADKYYLHMDSDTPFELVSIGDTAYIRTADGTWLKEVLPKSELQKYLPQNVTPEQPSNTPGAAKISYTRFGKEACGADTCLRYKLSDPSNTLAATYIWFDDHDYQLRHMQTTTADTTTDITYSYASLHVTPPSPVKELAAGQTLLPGQAAPTGQTTDNGLPHTGDDPNDPTYQAEYQAWLRYNHE